MVLRIRDNQEKNSNSFLKTNKKGTMSFVFGISRSVTCQSDNNLIGYCRVKG